jgi:hypothetical protein
MALVTPLNCFHRVSRLALAVSLAAGCATAPEPVETPPPVVSRPPDPPPAVSVQQSAPSVTQAAEPPAIIIHHADLHGRFESKQGSTVTIRALLVMSKTKPEVGNQGVLFFSPGGGQGDEEWVAFGDVEVKKPLDSDGRIQLKITGDEKQSTHSGKKAPLSKNMRMKLSWQW